MKTKRFAVGVTALIAALICATSLSACDVTKHSAAGTAIPNAYVTIDINPSVEIFTGEDGLVKQVNALNDDAAMLLIDMNFDGMTADEAVAAILAEAEKTGFIVDNADNAVIVTVEADDKTQELETILDKRVEAFALESSLNITFMAADATSNPELAQKAEANGLTLGKMKLVELALKYDKNLTLDIAKAMSVKELNSAVYAAREAEADFVTDEMKREFDIYKARLEAASESEEVRLFNEAVQGASDAEIESCLSGYSAAQFRLDVQAMYEKVAAINLDDLAQSAAPTLSIDQTTIIKTLALAFDTAEQQFQDAIGAGQKDKHVVQTIRKAIKEAREALEEYIDDVEDSLEYLHGEVDIEIHIDGAEVDISVNVDIDDKYEEAIEEIVDGYYEDFEDKGIDIDGLEDKYEDQIEGFEDSYEERMDAMIAQYKSDLKTQIDAVKAALKAEKEALKALTE